MAKHMWPVPRSMRSSICPACKTTGGHRYFCDQCETQFCGFCSYPKHHRCRSKANPRPATTSKAAAPALIAQQAGRATISTPLPLPPPQQKPTHALPTGTHPQSRQHEAMHSPAQERQGSCSSKKPVSQVIKPRRRRGSKDPPRSPSTELEDYMRPLSTSRSSPSREQTSRPHKREHKTHKEQGKALSNTLQPREATELLKHAKQGGRESKKRRTTHHHQSHGGADSVESSPKAWTQTHPRAQRPGVQSAHQQDKIDQEWEGDAGEDREVELTHTYSTYRLQEKVYTAVVEAIRAGHKLDLNRTTWGLSQINQATALIILSNLSHPMYTSAQQYLDHCVDDEWHADFGQQRGHPTTQYDPQGRDAQAQSSNQCLHAKPQYKK